MRASSLIAVTLAAAQVLGVAAQPYGKIDSLPGWSPVNNQAMYSGYITVNATAGRQLFFWLVESSNNPATDPLVFWTNGGPGCSSVGGGLFSESGPFRPNAAGGLSPNPWTWSSAANMLYVEQPAGVGFSYSNNTADYTVGDARAADDVFWFLQGFMKAFPQFAAAPLWITGESYGGHYVPSIARSIVQYSKSSPDLPAVNLAGIMVGNAWTDSTLDNTGAVEAWWGVGAISNDTRNGILATCNMSEVGPLFSKAAAAGRLVGSTERPVTQVVNGHTLAPHRHMGFKPAHPVLNAASNAWELPTYQGADCTSWSNQATAEMGSIDIYDAFDNVCPPAKRAQQAAQLAAARAEEEHEAAEHARKHTTRGGRHLSGKKHHQRGGKGGKAVISAAGPALATYNDSNVDAGCAAEYNPCIDDLTTAYLNRADVQAAIHVMPSTIPGGSWVSCSNLVNYSYPDLLASMIPTWQYLLQNWPQGKWLVFSGSVDLIVPFTGTRLWLSTLGWPTTTAFHPWYTPENQIGGWAYAFTSPWNTQLHYATVRNAGHLVPELQASRALQMFTTFLAGNSL